MSPNQPRTPNRVIRVPDELWDAARGKARREGTDVSKLIRAFLTEYVNETKEQDW